MKQEPTQGQASQTAGASKTSEARMPREQTQNTGKWRTQDFLSSAFGMLGGLFSKATEPGTENPEAQTSRSQASRLQNWFMKLFGKDKPHYDAARNLRNTPWEKKRGNDYSKSYDADGRLSLTLHDGVLREQTLQMLAALDASETKELDPSSSGIGKFQHLGKMTQHSTDKAMCDQLLGLRERLRADGGSLEVVPSSDGFGRVLKITIDPRNKTVEEIQKEITDVFSTLGVGSPQMAESIAKELVRTRDSQKTTPTAGMSSSVPGPRHDAHTTVTQDLSMTGTPEHSTRNPAPSVPEPQVSSSRDFSAATSADSSAPGIDPARFSLSGNAGAVPSQTGRDYSAMQGQYLSSSTHNGHAPDEPTRGGPYAPAIDVAALSSAAEGMDIVTGVSNVNIASPIAAPAVTNPEATASQAKGTSRGA